MQNEIQIRSSARYECATVVLGADGELRSVVFGYILNRRSGDRLSEGPIHLWVDGGTPKKRVCAKTADGSAKSRAAIIAHDTKRTQRAAARVAAGKRARKPALGIDKIATRPNRGLLGQVSREQA